MSDVGRSSNDRIETGRKSDGIHGYPALSGRNMFNFCPGASWDENAPCQCLREDSANVRLHSVETGTILELNFITESREHASACTERSLSAVWASFDDVKASLDASPECPEIGLSWTAEILHPGRPGISPRMCERALRIPGSCGEIQDSRWHPNFEYWECRNVWNGEN